MNLLLPSRLLSSSKSSSSVFIYRRPTTTSSSISILSSSPLSCCSWKWISNNHQQTITITNTTKRTHYSYSGPGSFGLGSGSDDDDHHHRHDWFQRGYTVGIGGPVGSGKTALVLALTKLLTSRSKVPLGVVTNDIFTQEDAQFLSRHKALPPELIRAVETGGCPHAAIREDVSANLTACEDLTRTLVLLNEDNQHQPKQQPPMILCESGGDNLAANFSRELADLTLYVIDVAGGDKVPRKGGPGITQSDLLIINKIDLADAVGSDLNVMERDANQMRKLLQSKNHDNGDGEEETYGPTIFTSVKQGIGLSEIENFILKEYHAATATSTTSNVV